MTRHDFLGFAVLIPALLDKLKPKLRAQRGRPRRDGPTPEDEDRLRARLEEAPQRAARGARRAEDRRRKLAVMEALEPFGNRKVEVLTEILRSSPSNPIRLGAACALG